MRAIVARYGDLASTEGGLEERDLIVGVLAAQAGFVTAAEFLTALAGGLVEASSESLLTRLERSGGLTETRRKLLEPLAEQVMAARSGGGHPEATSLDASTLLETLASQIGGAVPPFGRRSTRPPGVSLA